MIYIVVVDVDTAIENAKLAVLEQIEFQIFLFFFALSQPWRVGGQIRKFSGILQKLKCNVWCKLQFKNTDWFISWEVNSGYIETCWIDKVLYRKIFVEKYAVKVYQKIVPDQFNFGKLQNVANAFKKLLYIWYKRIIKNPKKNIFVFKLILFYEHYCVKQK